MLHYLLALILSSVLVAESGCPLTAAQLAIQGDCPTNPNGNSHTCLADQYTKQTQCTSNDVPITNVVACNGDDCSSKANFTCTQGKNFTSKLAFSIRANAKNRYDFGLFVAYRQRNASTGNCCRFMLYPSNGTSNATGGCGPYENFDGDVCGDVFAGVVYTEIILIDLLCQPTSPTDPTLVLPYCSVWGNNEDKLVCSRTSDLQPGTGSKCKCGTVPIPNVRVLPSGIAAGIAAGSSACYTPGQPIKIYFRVNNTQEDTITSISATDDFNSTIQCCNQKNVINPALCTFTTVPPPSSIVLSPNDFLLCQALKTANQAWTGDQTDVISITALDSQSQTVSASAFTTLQRPSIDVSQTVTNDGNWTLTIRNNGSTTFGSLTVDRDTSIYSPPCNLTTTTFAPGDTLICVGTTNLTNTTICHASSTVTVSAANATGVGCTANDTDTTSINFVRVCRPKLDICGADESCPATDPSVCPPDVNNTNTSTVCNPDGNGDCNLDDTCDGHGGCPPKFQPNTHQCRAQNGDCDVPEFCNGTSKDCPPDSTDKTLCANFTCAPATCSPTPPHNCSYANNDDACAVTPICVHGRCIGNNQTLINKFGPPTNNATGCRSDPEDSRCFSCDCTGAVCDPTNPNRWTDGCRHLFNNASGGMVLTPDQQNLTICH